MKKILNYTTYLLVISQMIWACDANGNNTYLNGNCSNFREFDIDSSGDNRGYNSMQINNEYLNIPRIDKPSDTFFLRLHSNTEEKLKIFEYSVYSAKANYKIYTFPLERKSGKILFDNKRDNLKEYENVLNLPRKDFLKVLKENRILELPDSKSVLGYPHEEFQSGITIEFANKCKYKIITYPDPYAYSKKYKEAEALVNLLNYLKEEYDF